MESIKERGMLRQISEWVEKSVSNSYYVERDG